MSLRIAKPLEDYTESEWDGQMFRGDKSVAKMLGWRLCYHTLRSKGTQTGFPDRVLVRDRVVFVETKSMKGKPTEDQIDWLNGITRAGGEAYLWRPSDLDEAGRVLSKRWVFLPRPAEGGRLHDGETYWVPGSIWVCDRGRYDSIAREADEIPGQTSIDDFVS